MTWNGPIDGDYSNCDFTKGPWAAGVMTLSHDECIHVLQGCQTVIDNYDPKDHDNQPADDFYVQSEYNKLDWQYAINGDTYAVVKTYNTEFNTQGVNESGIIPEPEVFEPEPTPEAPTEEPTPEEGTTEVVTPEAPTEETTTEDPAE
jgi:hypothetical protein